MLLSLLMTCFISAAPASAKVVDKIVAVVNDQIITESDADSFKKSLANGGMMDDALIQMVDPKKLLTDRDALLNYLIDEKVLDSEVKKKNLEVTVERVEEEIRDIMKKRNVTRDQLEQVLKERGISMSQYQDYIKTSLERHALIDKEVSSKIRISDEDVASYYLAQKGPSKTQSYEYTIAHILIIPKKGKEEQAKAKAKAAWERLKSGESFDTIAEQYSEDPNFSKGGLLGTFTTGEMRGDIESAVKRLQAGEFSPVVRTKSGYDIFKVLKRTLIADPKMEAEKDQIRGTLFGEAFKKQFRAWLAERREDAFVKINGWS